MKISILEKNFKRGLGLVGNITSKNINLPILNNVLIKAEGGIITLVSTNLEIGVTHSIRGKIEKEGGFTVDAKILTNYIGLLPNEKVDVEQKDNYIAVACGRYKTKVNGQPADDFPLIPSVEKNIYYSAASAEEFKNALAQVIFAASTNESRLELSGILFTFSPEKLTLAATDSYRLAEKKISVKSNAGKGEDRKIIVPARTVQEVIRILSNIGEEDEMLDGEKDVKCYISESQVLFKFGSTELVSRLIEGQFPDYTQIIPKSKKTEILISRQELLRATKTSSIFSRSEVNDINMDVPEGKNKIIISSCSDYIGENLAEIEAATHGSDNALVLNYRYLLDGLNNIKSDMVRLEVVDNNSPCLLKPDDDSEYLYIIMPIKR